MKIGHIYKHINQKRIFYILDYRVKIYSYKGPESYSYSMMVHDLCEYIDQMVLVSDIFVEEEE